MAFDAYSFKGNVLFLHTDRRSSKHARTSRPAAEATGQPYDGQAARVEPLQSGQKYYQEYTALDQAPEVLVRRHDANDNIRPRHHTRHGDGVRQHGR